MTRGAKKPAWDVDTRLQRLRNRVSCLIECLQACIRALEQLSPGDLGPEEALALATAREYCRHEEVMAGKARAALAGVQASRMARLRRLRELRLEGSRVYGWLWSREEGKWVVDRHTRKIGERVVKWIEGGNSFVEVEAHLYAQGVKTVRGHVWSRHQLEKLYVLECRERDREWKQRARDREKGRGKEEAITS